MLADDDEVVPDPLQCERQEALGPDAHVRDVAMPVVEARDSSRGVVEIIKRGLVLGGLALARRGVASQSVLTTSKYG